MIHRYLRTAARPQVEPQVRKIENFSGSLPERPLYIYLPPGYHNETRRHYPVLYMHDGQNCFETYREDSYAGITWAADRTADYLIQAGLMRPCLIVGVGHGGEERILEYTPPYASHDTRQTRRGNGAASPAHHIRGRADKTFKYYRDEVAPYIHEHYRALGGRHQTATCGSSMGGLFAMYIGWEFPEFAAQHAALSASFWATARPGGSLEIAERIRRQSPRPVRFYLDSGTEDIPGQGDDNSAGVVAVRDSLYEKGYRPGIDLQYQLAHGAIHGEAAWADRLPAVLQFLFPTYG